MNTTTKKGNAICVERLTVKSPAGRLLLQDISFSIRTGSLNIITGLSGCGKSTLLKALAGISEAASGKILFGGHTIQEIKRIAPLTVSYLPQFSAFHSSLTVREILEFSSALRLPTGLNASERVQKVNEIIEISNIEPILDQCYSTLSGGQMRRISLAQELLGEPSYLLLDELTTGLDILSDEELMEWLRNIAVTKNKTILIVTHSCNHIAEDDSVLLLKAGRLIYQGHYGVLLSQSGVVSIKEVYKSDFSDDFETGYAEAGEARRTEGDRLLKKNPLPGFWIQFTTLLKRQGVLFFRDKGGIVSHVALIVVFPLLVTVFALEGLPQVRNLSSGIDQFTVSNMTYKLSLFRERGETATLVSGLTMLQAILLTLLGANNSAREIAKEKAIVYSEFYAGMSREAYVASKVFYIIILSAIQAFWMTLIVKSICGFPGGLGSQFFILLCTVLSMSAICLAVSAASSSVERASLMSVYFVGFQLPLSGAALPLPESVAAVTKPLISAYWGWAGYLRTLSFSQYTDLVERTVKTSIASYPGSVAALLLQISVSICASLFFVRQLSRIK